jgi:hypothetical protein
MINVKINLNPFGSGHLKPLADIYIINVTDEVKNTPEDSYVYVIKEPKSAFSEGILCGGLITGYERLNPVVNLLAEVLKSYSNNESHDYTSNDIHPLVAEYMDHLR